MCYQGNCVSSAQLFKNISLNDSCNPNPCQNGGLCVTNATTNSLYCKCSAGKIYIGNILLIQSTCYQSYIYNFTLDLLCSVSSGFSSKNTP